MEQHPLINVHQTLGYDRRVIPEKGKEKNMIPIIFYDLWFENITSYPS